MTDLDPIIAAVQDAVTLCRTIQASGFKTNAKGDDSPVTIADYGAQAIICRTIQQHFPDDAVIAEEGSAAFRELVSDDGQAQVSRLLGDILDADVTPADVAAWLDYGRDVPAPRTWVIDPIDGTIGYVNNRYYAVCVGVLQDKQPAQGVVGLPRSPIDTDGSIIYTDGATVYAMAMDGTAKRMVQASKNPPQPEDILFMDSVKLSPPEQAAAKAVREAAGLGDARLELYDSQLKYAMIAAGYGDVFIRMPRDVVADPHKIWDHAAGAALIQAAGGTITDEKGAPLDFSKGTTLPCTGMIASSGDETLHAALVRAVGSVSEI